MSVSNDPLGYDMGASFFRSSDTEGFPLSPVVDRVVSSFPTGESWSDQFIRERAEARMSTDRPETVGVIQKVKRAAAVTEEELENFQKTLSAYAAGVMQELVDQVYRLEMASEERYSRPLVKPMTCLVLEASATEPDRVFTRNDFEDSHKIEGSYTLSAIAM